MPLGILEDKHLEHVPGTALLEDLISTPTKQPVSDLSKLKRGTGANSHIILIPQPSDDPRDPLNWPTWKREALFWILCYTTGLVGAVFPLLAPGYVLLAEEWHVSVNAVASANGDLALSLGLVVVIQGVAVKYGRRPVLLTSIILLFFCCIWAAVSQGLTSLRVSRVFQGFGMAAFETLVAAVIGEIYFVHERGFRMAVWGCVIVSGYNIAPIVNGYIIESPILGWRWSFWIMTVFLGASLVAIVLLVPETSYDRQSQPDVVSAEGDIHDSPESTQTEKPEKAETHVEKLESSPQSYLPPKTFLEEMKPYSGYVNRASLFRTILRPFPFLLSPVIWYTNVLMSIMTVIVLSIASSVVFSLPPYNFTASQTGLVSIGPFIGSVIAMFLSGHLCDYAILWFAKRNNGIYEPESRLFLMFPAMIMQVAGLGFWALMQNRNVPWIGPVIMYSIAMTGQGFANTATGAYVIDVHGENAPECFSVMALVKGMIAFGFTQFSVAWVGKMGILHSFGIMAGMTVISIGSTIPMYIYGKRTRSWVHRHRRLFLVNEDKPQVM